MKNINLIFLIQIIPNMKILKKIPKYYDSVVFKLLKKLFFKDHKNIK